MRWFFSFWFVTSLTSDSWPICRIDAITMSDLAALLNKVSYITEEENGEIIVDYFSITEFTNWLVSSPKMERFSTLLCTQIWWIDNICPSLKLLWIKGVNRVFFFLTTDTRYQDISSLKWDGHLNHSFQEQVILNKCHIFPWCPSVVSLFLDFSNLSYSFSQVKVWL